MPLEILHAGMLSVSRKTEDMNEFLKNEYSNSQNSPELFQ